jgi:dTDP-glucose 4,6-dehydratase
MTVAYNRFHGLDTRIARIFNTYGPRMRMNDGRVVPTFVRQVLSGEPLTVFGDGQQTRSFCYVDDLIRGLDELIHSNVHDPVNLGNPAELSINAFAEAVARIAGTDPTIEYEPLPVDDPKVRQPDITRAKELLCWEPTVSLDDGLRQTIDWFRADDRYLLPD